MQETIARMKIVGLISVGVLCTVLVVVYVLEPVVFETYLIPSNMQEGWVTIEYANPKCPPLNKGRGWREYVIPESGYLCTSTQRNTEPMYQWFYLVDENGKRTRLATDEQIFQRTTIVLAAGNPNCKVVADSFWYGKRERINNEQDVALEKRHPECGGLRIPVK